jgi:hypothetical protein
MIFKRYFLVKMILKWGIVITFCLESFHSGNIAYFYLEWQKSNWFRTSCELYRHFFLCSAQLSRAERAKISISPMLDIHIFLRHAFCAVLIRYRENRLTLWTRVQKNLECPSNPMNDIDLHNLPVIYVLRKVCCFEIKQADLVGQGPK